MAAAAASRAAKSLAKNFRCAVRRRPRVQATTCKSTRGLCACGAAVCRGLLSHHPAVASGRILVRKAVVATRLLVAGEVSDYDAATRERKQAFASIASMPLSAVDVTISPASVVIEIHITYSTTEALAAVASIASQLGDAAVAGTPWLIRSECTPGLSKTVMVDAAYLAPGMPIIPS